MINCPYYFDKATTRRWEHKNFVLDEIERVDIYQYPSFFSRRTEVCTFENGRRMQLQYDCIPPDDVLLP